MRAQETGVGQRHVLVVDDWEEICCSVRSGLEMLGGYRVSTAGRGDDAVLMLDTDPPDLVVLDAVLPGMTGIEVAAHAVSRHIPVLLMTGDGPMDARLRHVGWPHLRKPFHLDDLVMEVQRTLGEAQANIAAVMASLKQLYRTGEELRTAIGHSAAMRVRIRDTIARSRRSTDPGRGR